MPRLYNSKNIFYGPRPTQHVLWTIEYCMTSDAQSHLYHLNKLKLCRLRAQPSQDRTSPWPKKYTYRHVLRLWVAGCCRQQSYTQVLHTHYLSKLARRIITATAAITCSSWLTRWIEHTFQLIGCPGLDTMSFLHVRFLIVLPFRSPFFGLWTQIFLVFTCRVLVMRVWIQLVCFMLIRFSLPDFSLVCFMLILIQFYNRASFVNIDGLHGHERSCTEHTIYLKLATDITDSCWQNLCITFTRASSTQQNIESCKIWMQQQRSLWRIQLITTYATRIFAKNTHYVSLSFRSFLIIALEGFDFRFGLAFAIGVGLGLASEEFLRLKSDAFAIGVGLGLEEVPAFLRLKSDR